RRFSRLPSTRPSFNTHSSRSGSVQRILSVVPAQGFPTLRIFFGGRAPPIECSSLASPCKHQVPRFPPREANAVLMPLSERSPRHRVGCSTSEQPTNPP